MRLDPNFRELLSEFLDRDVRFLIVGGYALAAHGHPRYTGDLDVSVERTGRPCRQGAWPPASNSSSQPPAPEVAP